MKTEIKHGVPALMSFFVVGLGQMIKGHYVKGVAWFVAQLVLTIFVFALASFGAIPLFIGLILLFASWIMNIADAYNSNTP